MLLCYAVTELWCYFCYVQHKGLQGFGQKLYDFRRSKNLVTYTVIGNK